MIKVLLGYLFLPLALVLLFMASSNIRVAERATQVSTEKGAAAALLREAALDGMSDVDGRHEGMAFMRLLEADENGRIDRNTWVRAHEQARSMRKTVVQSGDRSPGTNAAGLSSATWDSIGPGNVGGRIRAIAFDPDNSDRLYVGAVSGGIWISENGGESWGPADDFMGNLGVTSIVFDPTDSNIMYAGTGEVFRGAGVFKSGDKGETWTSLEGTFDNSAFWNVNRLAMLPDGSRLIAATITGIYFSDDDGVSWTETRRGRTYDIELHPFSAERAIAGGSGYALFSDDGGSNWQVASGLQGFVGRVELAYARSNPDIVYASVDVDDGEIWRSTDGGASYSLINTGNRFLLGQGSYNNSLWVDPRDSSHLIAGGIALSRSTDGGVTMEPMSASVHVDHHFIVEHPDYDGLTNRRVFFANDGGISKALDIFIAPQNLGWQNLNNELAITQFYGVSSAPDGTLVGGTQDNGSLAFSGSASTWVGIWGFDGDSGKPAIDQSDPAYIYSTGSSGRIVRKSDGPFGPWEVIFDEPIPNILIPPLVLDPNNPNCLFFGGRQLLRSLNARSAAPSFTAAKAETASGSIISAIAVAPDSSDIIYVGHLDGSLYRTDDGTASSPVWSRIGEATLPNRYITEIAIDPLDSTTVYVAFGGYSANNLWRSFDSGNTWSPAVGANSMTIPPAPIAAIAIHPAESDQVYVGTHVGIFTSDDGGETWSASNEGPANVAVLDLEFVDSDTLVAATFGRGIFRHKARDTVPSGNRSPELQPISNRRIAIGQTLVIMTGAMDPDSDVLQFDIGQLPDFCESSVATTASTATITCRPLDGDQGTYTIRVSVADDGVPALTDWEEFLVEVYKLNEPIFFLEREMISPGGMGVDIDDEVAAVGSQNRGINPVLVYDVAENTAIATFTNPNMNPIVRNSFGREILLAGGRVLVSAANDNSVDSNAGIAYLFDSDSGQLLRTLSHPMAGQQSLVNVRFGLSIGLTADRALIGSSRGVYLYDAGSGNLIYELPGREFFEFASIRGRGQTALSDLFIALGQPKSPLQSPTGQVVLFDSESLEIVRVLDNPTQTLFEEFGRSVAIDGHQVLVGVELAAIGQTQEAGRAYLFDGRTGQLLHAFVDPTPDNSRRFGWNLAVAGDLAAIASKGVTPDGHAVHVFSTVTGKRVQTLTGEIANYCGLFGFSLGLDGDRLIVAETNCGAKIYRLKRYFDVDWDFWAYRFIDRLAGSNITVGCGDKYFCPNDPVSRAQMAVFVERGMRGSDFVPPSASGSVFADVGPNDFAASFIEQLAADGITGGCDAANYCPEDSITRAQMAVFLLRARNGPEYLPPPPVGLFGDVPTDFWAAAWIEQLAAEGITSGCGSGQFCPDDRVTRAQMAVFLVRAFNL